MADKKSKTISPADHARLVALLEQTLSDSEFEELENDLRSRPELRKAWINLQDQESELSKHYSEPRPKPTAPLKNPAIFWSALCAACVLVALLWLRPSSESSFTSVDLPGLDGVAVVSKLDGVSWSNQKAETVEVGTYLKPGTLKLAEGKIELIFLSGASVAIEGPAEIQILSEDLAYLNHGKAAARVPEEAIGFTLKTPEAAIVDLGTEFAAEVDSNGKSLVHVYDGEVHVSLLGEDGSTLSGARLLSGQAASVNPQSHDLSPAPPPTPQLLPRVSTQDHSLLTIPAEYRSAVAQSEPIIHWTFEDGLSNGEIFGDVKPITGDGNTAMYFNQNGYIRSREMIPSLNKGDYSVEFWVKPDRFHYTTLFGLFHPYPDNPRPVHLNVIELMHKSHLIHQPNVVRFLHRWPDSEAAKHGEVNAFSYSSFIPGHWMHIVAVKEPKQIRLYINGQLSKSVSKISENHDRDYHLVLGQIDSLRDDRQFNGLLDEFALYPRALSPGEVLRHYSVISAAN